MPDPDLEEFGRRSDPDLEGGLIRIWNYPDLEGGLFRIRI